MAIKDFLVEGTIARRQRRGMKTAFFLHENILFFTGQCRYLDASITTTSEKREKQVFLPDGSWGKIL
jgi:hypothetical protein